MGLIDPKKLAMPIYIVGAGNIGSWTALALMKLGCQNVTVIDFDRVEEHNVGSQLYNDADTGETKVQAMADRIRLLAPNTPSVIERAWTPQEDLEGYDIIISAVDSIEVRASLFRSLQGSRKVFIDGRMGGNSLTVYTVHMDNPDEVRLYEQTLFEKGEALEIPCSERSVVYNCFVMAGMIANMVTHVANNHATTPELEIDLMNLTMYGGMA